MKQHTIGVFFGHKRKTTTDLSQTYIAEKLKVKPQFVSNWERAVSNPPPRLYKKLAKLLGVHKYEVEEQAIRQVVAEVENAFK